MDAQVTGSTDRDLTLYNIPKYRVVCVPISCRKLPRGCDELYLDRARSRSDTFITLSNAPVRINKY